MDTALSTYPNQVASGRPHTKPYVVVIFGRTGVGISSLTNLILGHPISKDHSNAKTATHRIKPYSTSFPGSTRQFSLYEVPGFGGPIPEGTILKTIRQIDRDEGIDLFVYCFRKQKATVIPNIVRLVRESEPWRQVPMIAVVTELERFEPGREMDDWWDVSLEGEDGHTNGTFVERMCFGGDDGFNAHVCVTTLPLKEVALLDDLRKRRDWSEERIRRVILQQCRRQKRAPGRSDPRCGCLRALFTWC